MDQSHRLKIIQKFFDQTLSPAEVDAYTRNALDQNYWRRLNPRLSIGVESDTVLYTNRIEQSAVAAHAGQFQREGYFQTAPALDSALVGWLRGAVETLRDEQWPPVFSFVYDEFWQIVRTPPIVRLLSSILGPGYRQNSLIWTFYVPSVKGARGWEPHADGSVPEPRVTVWVPFTDATLDNGCMYVIPLDRLQDDLRRPYADFNNVTNLELTRLLHNARAVPSPAGAYVGWNHELIHWGSVSSGVGDPRISIAVEFVGGDLAPRPDEEPLFDALAVPSFLDRIRAIGKALLTYRRYEPSFNRYAELGRRLFDVAGDR